MRRTLWAAKERVKISENNGVRIDCFDSLNVLRRLGVAQGNDVIFCKSCSCVSRPAAFEIDVRMRRACIDEALGVVSPRVSRYWLLQQVELQTPQQAMKLPIQKAL